MATLSEYAKLSNDVLLDGVYENIITTSELAPHLQFMSFEGNSLKYNRENALPTATTHAVGDTWADTEPTYTAKSASLAIVGVQAPLDRYALQTRSNVQSQEARLFGMMAKSLSRKIEDLIITGEPEAVTTQFEGLDSLCRADTRMMAMDDLVVDGPGTAETTLTLAAVDKLIDMIEDGLPDALIMNKTMRRKLTSLMRASGGGVTLDRIEMFGRQVYLYNTVPIVISDYITNSEQYNDSSTWPSSTATTIFAVKFGEDKQGYTIIHNGDVLNPDIQNIGIKEKANENLYRMVVYIQAVAFSAKMIAALGGIDSSS